MSKQRTTRSLFTKFIHSRWVHVAIVASYIIITAFYMFPQVTNCTDTVYGFGDNTAGLIWRHDVSPSSPMWGFEKSTNFPFGESLNNPVNNTSTLQYTWYWLLAKVAGPVCGYNLFNVIGFVATAAMMYGLVYWITRKHSIAWLAGYIVSFAPYFQYKVGGHPSYGYTAILIAAVWLFLALLKSGTKHRRLLTLALGLVVGFCFYWDPYFVLLIALALTSLSIAWLVYRAILNKRVHKTWRDLFGQGLTRLLQAALVAIIVVAPLLFLEFKNARSINEYVSSSRGNVMVDAQNCSILPSDYFIPSDSNYIAYKLMGDRYAQTVQKVRHNCNPAEYTVGLSWAVLTIVSIALVIWTWEKLFGRKIFEKQLHNIDYKLVVLCVGFMVVIAALIALPPHVGRLRFPSDILLHITSTWRILARLYVLVTIGVTVIFSIALLAFANIPALKQRPRLKIVLFLLILLAIVAQYQSFKPFSGSAANFSYSQDTPAIIFWVHDQNSIRNIAGYPLDKEGETEAPQYFLTYQTTSKKHMLNSALPLTNQDAIRFSIKDLTDPQTIPVLRGLGIDTLEIHGLKPSDLVNVEGITVIKYQHVVNHISGGDITIARINPGPIQTSAVLLVTGFPTNGEIMKTPVDLEYEVQQGAVLKVSDVRGRKLTASSQHVCFDVKMAATTDTGTVSVKQGARIILPALSIDGQYTHVEFDAPTDKSLTIFNNNGHNMRINNVGCRLQ